jgi:hypothetical protein
MKMTATKQVYYGGKERRPGEQFEATARDARILAAIRKATPAAPQAVTPKTQARDMTAEQPAAEPDDDGKGRKGRYRRRDMKAESDGD